MKRFLPLFLFFIPLLALTAQSSDADDDLTPEQKYLRTMLNPQGSGAGISMEYEVTGSADLTYGSEFGDGAGSYTQGFLTTIDSSLDINFTFKPDSFSASPRQSYLKQGIYAEIILTDFGVVISNDAGVDFWDNYIIYDSDGNAYLPDQESDTNVVLDSADDEDEVTYSETIFYTGIAVTEPTVEANIHLNPNMYFQISSQPDLDFNLATTLGGQGEWAGAETDSTGGFSFILEYPRLEVQASVVSQYYYTEADIVQDDEFGGGVSVNYDINDNLAAEGYLSIINFYDSDNNDDFYFVTDRSGSDVGGIILGGAALTFNYFELVEFGFYGDIGYVYGGEFNVGGTDTSGEGGTDDDYNLKEYDGFLYDVRVDLPFPFAGTKGVFTVSADTYGYTFKDDLFSESEMSEEIPLDLQLAVSYTEERWQIQGAFQAFNILDVDNDYENYLFDDNQELGLTLTGQYTFGTPTTLAWTPGLTLNYSTGRLMTEGWFWSTEDGSNQMTYEDAYYDDMLSLQASLALTFPQTVITLTYTSLQLLPGQEHSQLGDDYVDIDTGLLTISTVISY